MLNVTQLSTPGLKSKQVLDLDTKYVACQTDWGKSLRASAASKRYRSHRLRSGVHIPPRTGCFIRPSRIIATKKAATNAAIDMAATTDEATYAATTEAPDEAEATKADTGAAAFEDT